MNKDHSLIDDEVAADWMLAEDDSQDYSQIAAEAKARLEKMTEKERESYVKKIKAEIKQFSEELKSE